MADREQFERRLLALVRDYLNETDEEFPEGYEIEDFIVLYQVRFAPRKTRIFSLGMAARTRLVARRLVLDHDGIPFRDADQGEPEDS
jgi:hypothetical protein